MRTLLALLCLSAPLAAQDLGRIDFPTSAAPAAQAPFLRGVLLLHSFEYEDAAAAFKEAQAADSGFALAYWGEAMTCTHPLWNEQDSVTARAVLKKLGDSAARRLERGATARERGYLAAVEALYFGDGGKARRDTLYSEAMERLTKQEPKDDEALAFHALSLMGLSQGVRNIPSYMRAGAIAEEIYRRNPQHPGALHYIIHAFDDPTHAPLGLFAAREYSEIAGGADHAQHMTTHIFLALGMWPETVKQNAIASGDTTRWKPGHYTAWLNYGLLQQGQFAEASRQMGMLRDHLATATNAARESYLHNIRAHYLIDTERWTDPIAEWPLEPLRATPVTRAMDLYALAVAHLSRGHAPVADSLLRRIELDRHNADSSEVPGILADQLRGRLMWQAGKREEALTLLRATALRGDTLPAEFGPPDVVKPTHELLGELLLQAGRAGEAQREFEHGLAQTPGRARGLLGLARAARRAGDSAVAVRALDQLADNWDGADSDLAELAELRQLRAGR